MCSVETGDGKPFPVLCALRFPTCDDAHTRTDFAIDDKLIQEARRLGEHTTAEEAVTAAMEEYFRFCKQTKILDLFGTVDFDPEYDYKAKRLRKRR